MATEVTIPQLGESVTEGTITAWLVNVGDSVEADQPLFELSSDKIDTEVPSPAAGTLTEIRVQVDETVDVGTVVAVIGGGGDAPGGDDGAAGQDTGGEAADEAAAVTPDPAADEPAPDVAGGGEASEQVEPEQASSRAEGGDAGAAGSLEERESLAREDLAGGDADAGAGGTLQARAAQADDAPASDPQETTGTYEATEGSVPSPQEVSASGQGGGNGQTEGVLASPIVRRMVAENDLDLSAIRATGEGGRVTREDVEAAISGRGGQQAPRSSRPPRRPSPPPGAPAARREASGPHAGGQAGPAEGQPAARAPGLHGGRPARARRGPVADPPADRGQDDGVDAVHGPADHGPGGRRQPHHAPARPRQGRVQGPRGRVPCRRSCSWPAPPSSRCASRSSRWSAPRRTGTRRRSSSTTT